MSQNFTPGGTIDPNSFTSEELLKHIYRSVLEMNNKMDVQEKERIEDKKYQDGKIEKVNERIAILETRMQEKERYFKVMLTIISTVVGIIGLALVIINYIIE